MKYKLFILAVSIPSLLLATVVVDLDASTDVSVTSLSGVLANGLSSFDIATPALTNGTTGYTGPDLYGGIERPAYIGNAGVSDYGGSGWRVRLNQAQPGNWVTATHLFQTAAVSFDAANDTLNAASIFGGATTNFANAEVRFVVENAGSFYISESSGDLSTGDSTYTTGSFSIEALTATWYDYAPATGVDSGIGAMVSTPAFDDIDFIGFYVRADGDAANGGSNFGVREFTAMASTATVPFVSTQPQGATLAEGTPHNFTVVVSGAAPISYQWLKDGTNLVGETAATLSLTNVTLSDSGDYSVWASNTYGSVTSAVATLTVIEPLEGSLKGTRPNIIFFLGDDQNIVDQSAYGNNDAPTPITQTLSEEGLVFDKAFTGQAICAPTRSMLYTGRYPIRNGCFVNHTAVRPNIRSLPDYLEPLGYDVILAGKSHVKPADQFAWTYEWPSLAATEGRPHGWVPIGQITNHFANPGPKPFCMMITSHYPHPSWITNKAYTTVGGATYLPDDPDYRPYYASIAEKELELAAVLDALEANGLSTNTIVFFSDDHGNSGKFTVDDEGLHMAFIVRWPGVINPRRTSVLTSFSDFLPTAIELAGGTPPGTLDGKSMLPIFEARDEDAGHEFVYGVAVNQGIQKRRVDPQRSIHDGRYHYIWNFNTPERITREGITDYFYVEGADHWATSDVEVELYDTLTDPDENTNLAGQPGLAAIEANLKAELFAWMADQNDYMAENVSSPFLSVVDIYRLDLNNPDFGYEILPEYVNSLSGVMVDQHEITDPNKDLAGTTYGNWLTANHVYGTQDFDEDRDGFNNLYEFALGGDPEDPTDHGGQPSLNIVTAGGSNVVEFIHAKRSDAPGELSYSVEARTNLLTGSWQPVSATVESGALNSEFDMATNRVDTTEAQKYLRLKVQGSGL